MVNIICQEEYAGTIWCKQILSGLTQEIKKKRWNYTKSFELEEVQQGDTIFVIGSNPAWINRIISECNFHQMVPVVLCNQGERLIQGQYHYVCSDISGAMNRLVEELASIGRRRIALYGVNLSSVTDVSRMECFLKLELDRGDIYLNKGALEECFQNFYPDAEKYDAVICVNSYAAISLMKKLEALRPQILKDVIVISCTEPMLSSKYNELIVSVTMNLEQYGKAAMTILEMTAHKEYISSVAVYISWEISNLQADIKHVAQVRKEKEKDRIYEDSELLSMSRVDYLLSTFAETDSRMIQMLINGATYSEIGEACHMSDGTVKYHVKKYMEICKVRKKQDLLDMLRDYLG